MNTFKQYEVTSTTIAGKNINENIQLQFKNKDVEAFCTPGQCDILYVNFGCRVKYSPKTNMLLLRTYIHNLIIEMGINSFDFAKLESLNERELKTAFNILNGNLKGQTNFNDEHLNSLIFSTLNKRRKVIRANSFLRDLSKFGTSGDLSPNSTYRRLCLNMITMSPMIEYKLDEAEHVGIEEYISEQSNKRKYQNAFRSSPRAFMKLWFEDFLNNATIHKLESKELISQYLIMQDMDKERGVMSESKERLLEQLKMDKDKMSNLDMSVTENRELKTLLSILTNHLNFDYSESRTLETQA